MQAHQRGWRQLGCPACCPTKECYPSGCCRSGFRFQSSINSRRLWACGRRRRRWATQPRSGALSTVAVGAPQAHRQHAHGLPGAKRPACRRQDFFELRFQTSMGITSGDRRRPRTCPLPRTRRARRTQLRSLRPGSRPCAGCGCPPPPCPPPSHYSRRSGYKYKPKRSPFNQVLLPTSSRDRDGADLTSSIYCTHCARDKPCYEAPTDN